jgi:hypothetical protein
MTRSGDKFPFPMPQTGVISDQHPFAVGTGQLLRAQNWINVDGIFRTRDGLLSVDPPKKWWEQLSLSENLIPDGLAEGDAGGISNLFYNTDIITVSVSSDDAPFGDHQYEGELTSSAYHYDHHHHSLSDWITTIIVDAEPGLPYTGWVYSGPNTTSGQMLMEFMDDSDQVIEAHYLEGDAILHGLWTVTETSPPQTTGVRFKFIPIFGTTLLFGPMKIAQTDTMLAWTYGAGYAGTPDANLYDVEVAHPYDGQVAIEMWDPIAGREIYDTFDGDNILGLFDDYDNIPVLGHGLAFAVQPKHQIPSFDEETGLLLKEAYWADITAGTRYSFSASYFFDVEYDLIADMKYLIEIPIYDSSGSEITTLEAFRALPVDDGSGNLVLTATRGREEYEFVAPALAAYAGLRLVAVIPTAEREIVYDNYGEIVYDNDGSIVTIEGTNQKARRVGFVLDDVKLCATIGQDARWWDFVMPAISHTGPYNEGEYALNYLLHDYLDEGVTESNRIIQATQKNLWKWDDTANDWDLIGFDLGTVYSSWWLKTTDDDGEVTYGDDGEPDSRFTFEQTSDDGYTSEGAEADELTIEIEMPAASEDAENPAPGGYWKYRVNGGDWSDNFDLVGEDPVLEAEVEYNSRDFAEECVVPEDFEGDPVNPVWEATVASRRHDGESSTSCFNTDRDGPVDLRGYDYAQKTWVVAANPNDRVVAWDGQSDSDIQRAGSNAPFAKTICIAGGRVLAGNLKFDDPYNDLTAPLAVAFSDTFLSQGFNNWHPELAIRLADTPGEIVKLLEMGTLAVAAYKTDAVYMLVYQTGNNPFRTQLMASSIAGPCGVRAVSQMTENTHMYLGEDGGIYVFDQSYPRMFSTSISKTIESELDLSFKDRVFLTYTPRENAALVMYPTKGSDGRVNRGMYIDVATQAGWPFEWDIEYFDFTAGAPVQTVGKYKMGGVTMRMGYLSSALASGESRQPDHFLGTYDGTTYVMDETALDDWGRPVYAHCRSGLTEFGLQSRYSLLKELELIVNRTNKSHNLDVEVWGAKHGADPKPVSHETIDISAEGPYEAEVREKGRFWGYGLSVMAHEQIVVNGLFAAVARLGHR